MERYTMGTSAESLGIVDTEGERTDGSADPDLPTREELWQIVQNQRDRIDELETRVYALESDIDTVEKEAENIEKLAEQFNRGSLAGPEAADLILEMADVPEARSQIDGQTLLLFRNIISERLVGVPVTSTRIHKWFDFSDTSNPSQKIKRMMNRLEQWRSDGFLIGEIETGKHRGKNAVWLHRMNE